MNLHDVDKVKPDPKLDRAIRKAEDEALSMEMRVFYARVFRERMERMLMFGTGRRESA